MRFFAIRHKPTGLFMPAKMSRFGRAGWSHWSPVPPIDLGHGPVPRLFATRRAAANSLTLWLQGAWSTRTTRGSYFDPPEYDGVAPDARPERRAEDMEIVSLSLTETTR